MTNLQKTTFSSKDLRVGNFILIDNRVTKVIGIGTGEEGEMLIYTFDLEGNASNHLEQFFKPIPLTAGSFRAMGFKIDTFKRATKDLDNGSEYVGYQSFSFTPSFMGRWEYFGAYWGNVFLYVHQVQNLFHSLTGYDLKVSERRLKHCKKEILNIP